MAIMDVPTLEPLAAALPRLLKEDGRLVTFSLYLRFLLASVQLASICLVGMLTFIKLRCDDSPSVYDNQQSTRRRIH